MVVSDIPVSPQLDDHLVYLDPGEDLTRNPLMPDPPTVPPSALTRALAKGIVALCDVLEIPLDQHRMALLDRLDAPALEALLEQIRAEHRWP